MKDYLNRIDGWATERPDHVAFLNSGGESITYAQLKEQSDALAASLYSLTQDRNPVIVFGHKSPLMLVCFLACMKSGHAYVPVDAMYPESRIRSIFDQLDNPICLDTCDQVPESVAVDAREYLGSDALRNAAAPADGISPDACLRADETMYILFTSGSTGVPKGVEVLGECAMSLRNYLLDEFDYDHPQVFFNRAPFVFDLSVTDLILSPARGDTMFALVQDHEESLADTFSALSKSDLTFWVSTPSVAEMCLRDPSFCPDLLPRVHTFFFVGEVLKNETAGMLLDRFPGCTVINGYGPTEACDFVTMTEISRQMVDADEALPVGFVKPGVELFVLDSETLEPCRASQHGELFIVGDSVARGYWGRDDLTEAAFHSCPSDLTAGRRSYRTGDEVCLDEEGMLHCFGRLDTQVKLHGYRIELGDIEANLESIEAVYRAVVVPVVRRGSISHLLAYVMPSGAMPAADELFDAAGRIKHRLGESLPAYMVPRTIKFIEDFPLTPNGKIDRKELEARHR